MAKSLKSNTHKCRFCDKEFKREDTILTHKCIKRDRYNDRESRTMREAFRLYMQFMDIHKLSMKKDVEPLMYFIKSKYFNHFYDFAVYILNNDILNKDEFTKYIMTSGRSVFEWTLTSVLEEWILKCIRDEHPRRGVERSIPSLVEWSETTGNEWNTFFDNVSPARAISWIECGKISPWLLWIVPPESLNKLLNRFSDSEFEYILKYIDPTYFEIKRIKYQSDCEQIRQMLIEVNL